MTKLPRKGTEADHEKWFDEQVSSALLDAADPKTQWVSHELVRKDWENRRASLVKQIDVTDKIA